MAMEDEFLNLDIISKVITYRFLDEISDVMKVHILVFTTGFFCVSFSVPSKFMHDGSQN